MLADEVDDENQPPESGDGEPDPEEPASKPQPRSRSERRAASALAKAWWSLALIPLAGGVALVVGGVVPAVLGYDGQDLESQWWVAAVAGAAAAVVLCAPLFVTRMFVRRARSQPGARTPMIVGAAIVMTFVLLTVASVVLATRLD
ncbi:hypothetical protein [Demequina sp. NBRC 110054]|uniref:hypothetical protein n=1 Tax=Demequina sp. NBRC 110054 TaxID=1570343 RepID=UPI000A00701D|nr:hypothetical protein [Demequina sp. NBRC 110054]